MYRNFTLSFALAVVACVLAFASCKKIKGDNQDLDPNNQVENDYMSTKPGSWWLFGANDGTVFKRKATGRDSMKKGLLFSYYETVDTNTQNITPEYFGKNLDKYVGLFDLNGSQTDYIAAVLLRDSAKTGDTWTNTDTYQGQYDVLVESEVQATEQQLVLNGKTYDHVTQVHNSVKGKLKLVPTYINCGSIDDWFARGVGLIKEDVHISILGVYTLDHKDSLLDYHIQP